MCATIPTHPEKRGASSRERIEDMPYSHGGEMERRLRKAQIADGWVICPGCRKKLARVYYGASCQGVELFCKACREQYILEL